MSESNLQRQKQLVREFHRRLDQAGDGEINEVLAEFTAPDFLWRGMHPFYEQHGAEAVGESFWRPFRRSFTRVQRRPDVFMAGLNDSTIENGIAGSSWVCSMGHLVGLFDHAWLGIPPTGKLAFLRYAEFNRIENDRIVESAFFCDLISVMMQAGLNPLPEQTGAFMMTPGPRTHDGLLYDEQDSAEGEKTLALINKMIGELSSDYFDSPEEQLGRSWHDDMYWFGPAGIGATYTRSRYRKQHQGPFREHLEDITYHGHVCRMAEGHFGGFFGWANLSMKSAGGFMGLPASDRPTEMRVVDIYRRDGDKLAENWIFIDLLHFLYLQKLDVLGRLREIGTH